MDTATPAETNLVAEIVDLTRICGGQLPPSPEVFWGELAVWRNVQPAETLPQTVRKVLESFDLQWDDDYLEDDRLTPAVAAIEAVYTAILSQDRAGGQISEEQLEDEEDDSIETSTERFSVDKSDPPVKTVVDFIENGQWVLDPSWQRNFVWKRRKQQALIESLLLALPIPSFLLYKERESGKHYVIDGRQRFETLWRFTRPKEKRGERKLRFRTFGPKQESWRPGQPLNEAANKYYDDLPPRFKSEFEMRPLTVFTLSNVTLPQLYQIFKRYNTGSVSLNAAEIRNAVYQVSRLHQMMFRLGGEHLDPKAYLDSAEADVGETLRQLMQRKKERYGAYDFIGRFFAFRHESKGSVAKATNDFMGRQENNRPQRVEQLRQEFISAFRDTLSWYTYPLVTPSEDGTFHAFLATIQMVSTSHLLEAVASGRTDGLQVKEVIDRRWVAFAETVLSKKQNSTIFWSAQRDWIDLLRSELKI